MILDSARVALTDGTVTPAMEIVTGREVLSFISRKATRARVLDKKVGMSRETVGVLLSSGQRLCGSRDQEVAIQRGTQVRYIPLADVTIGDTLRGEVAGMPVSVQVTGLMFYPRQEVRLVGFEMDQNKNFVAEGILCR